MKVETKNTITTRIDLTKAERDILKEARDIINEFLEELPSVTDINTNSLEEMAEQDTCLPNDFKDISIILALDGKTLTFEE